MIRFGTSGWRGVVSDDFTLRYEETGMRRAVVPFMPDPRMNDSFFSS